MDKVRQIKLREARDAVERNLELAAKHPAFEDKFIAQAIEAETRVAELGG